MLLAKWPITETVPNTHASKLQEIRYKTQNISTTLIDTAKISNETSYAICMYVCIYIYIYIYI